ncbi:MAG: hypothetical protein M1819_000858 [Sarea resinae]|nr:MAG: hypothetical protein M1819_000858 [Sarea resinae]
MDVDRFSFQDLLPKLLTSISRAHFVSFDLELSGIYTKVVTKARFSEAGDAGKQTLQQRYEEMKEAAERYQVLQIGLTCIEEDLEKGITIDCVSQSTLRMLTAGSGVYIAKPYNFHINPVVEERLNIDRIFSYQSGAVTFLMEHGFRMEAPFTLGVPYLSRSEEALAKDLALARLDKASFADIQIKVDDVESLDFLQRVRVEIDSWVNKPKFQPKPDFLNIAPIGHATEDPNTRVGLNNFQKRLIHQLVRAEYPNLVTIGKSQFIQIVNFDQKREDSIKRDRISRLNEQISRQTGFRWLVEAMIGGDLSGLNNRPVTRSRTGPPDYAAREAWNRAFEKLQVELKQRRTILVGHNLFTDLVNFYRCFLGDLPDDVRDFQRIIHKLFPLIIDTKYLATHEETGSIIQRSSLQEIEEVLRKQEYPVIETYHENIKYLSFQQEHEAGYDSYLTAKVLILLSTKLAADKPSMDTQVQPVTLSEQDLNAADPDHEGGVSLPSSPTEYQPAVQTHKKKKKRVLKKANPATTSTFAHTTIFDRLSDLIDLSLDDSDGPASPSSASSTQSSASVSACRATAATIAQDGSSPPSSQPTSESMMPPFFCSDPTGDHHDENEPSSFWRVYGNKLRVYGTAEEVVLLGVD